MRSLKRCFKNIISILIFIVFFGIVVSSLEITAFAFINPIVDNASLLSNEEKEEIISDINIFREKYNLDLVIVTTNDIGGKSAKKFADSYYEDNGYGFGEDNSGLLLLVDMGGRNIWISTEGKAIKYFTDNRLDSIIEDISKYISNAQYEEGFKIFITDVKYYMDVGIPENQYIYDETSHTRNVLIVAFVVAMLCGIVICLIVINSYNKTKSISSINYVDKNSIIFRNKKDIFINTYTTRTKIEKQNNTSSAGKSTTHKSSSGRSHGGHGGSF